MFARILYLTAALLLTATVAAAQSVTVIGPVTPGNCATFNSTTVIKDAGSPCGGGGGGAVSSVSNSDGSLTISPTTGAVIASLNVGHSNAWSVNQTFVSAQIGSPLVGLGGTSLSVGNNSASGQAIFRFDNSGLGFLINQVASGGLVHLNQQANAGISFDANNVPVMVMSPGGPLTISPIANSLNNGLDINQSGPTTGNTTGAFAFNLVCRIQRAKSLPCTQRYSDFGWWSCTMTAFRVNYTIGGANLGAQENVAIIGHTRVTSATSYTGDMVGVGGITYVNQNVSTGGEALGVGGLTVCDNGCVVNFATAFEAEVAILGTGTAVNRVGIYLGGGQGTKRGTSLDTAIYLQNGGTTGGEWAAFAHLSGGAGINGPFFTGGNFIEADAGAVYQMANFITLPGMVFTGNIFAFNTMTLTGLGALTVTQGNIVNNQNAVTSLSINNATSGTASASDVVVNNGANFGAFGVTSASWTTAPTILVNKTFVRASVAPGGLLLDTGSAAPIIFGINDVEMVRVTPGGTLAVGVTTDSGAGVVIANVAMVSPVVLGGQTSSATLTLESTNVGGTSDQIIFKTGSQVVAAFINTSQQVTIGPNVAPISGPALIVNENTLQVPSGNLSGKIAVQFGGTVNQLSRYELIGAGNGNFNGQWTINFLQSRGTFSSPTATQTGDLIGAFGASGFTGNGTTPYQTGGGAGIIFLATETFDATPHSGTKTQFQATPNGTGVQITYLEFGGANAWQAYSMATGAGNGAICGDTNASNATGGSVRYNNNAACTASLQAYKRNIRPLNAGLDEVMKLRPKQFFWRAGHSDDGEREHIGLIAEDVEKIDRRLVTYNVDGTLGSVDYVYSVTLAFRAIQELKADNDNLRAQLAQLRRMKR